MQTTSECTRKRSDFAVLLQNKLHYNRKRQSSRDIRMDDIDLHPFLGLSSLPMVILDTISEKYSKTFDAEILVSACTRARIYRLKLWDIAWFFFKTANLIDSDFSSRALWLLFFWEFFEPNLKTIKHRTSLRVQISPQIFVWNLFFGLILCSD